MAVGASGHHGVNASAANRQAVLVIQGSSACVIEHVLSQRLLLALDSAMVQPSTLDRVTSAADVGLLLSTTTEYYTLCRHSVCEHLTLTRDKTRLFFPSFP